MKLVYILLAIGVLKAIWVYQAYHALTPAELKRRARAHAPGAASINKLTTYGGEVDLLLWLIGLACAIPLIIWSAHTTWWLAALAIIIPIWLMGWSPKPRPGGWVWRIVAWSSRYTIHIFVWLHPVLKFLANLVPERAKRTDHSGLYAKEDFLRFINAQNHQLDNRIPQTDLKMAFNALAFADKKVADAMTPRRKARFVAVSETIGPMLMDELHATGFTRFAVTKEPVKKSAPQIIGSLYLGDLLKNLDKPGKVKDISTTEAFYINDSCTLAQSLDAFLKTGSQLLIVVDKFQEVVGVLTLDELLAQVVGKLQADDFNDYTSLRAVANLQAESEAPLLDDHPELSPK